MKRYLLILTLLIFVTSSCTKDDDFVPDLEVEPTSEDNGQNTEGSSGTTEEEGALTLYRIAGNSLSKIKDYSVKPNLLNYQQDYAKHLQMWDFVTRLIPIEDRDKISQFEVFHGGEELAGYVTPINENDLSKWKLGLAIDLAQDLETISFKNIFTYVTIHEYGHIVSLNNEQVQVGVSETCNNYFTGEGCSNANSYINRLYELGWKDIYQELNPENPEVLYEKYKDRFVSEYAATNPGEDIAEVFAFFITKEDKPSGNTIADQKIKLLYDFPELVELRNKIRKSAPVRALRAGSWVTNPMYNKFKVCGRKGCKH